MRATAGSKLSGLTATAMIGLAALELVYLIGDAELAGLLGRGAALMVVVVVAPRFGAREWALLGVLTAGFYLLA